VLQIAEDTTDALTVIHKVVWPRSKCKDLMRTIQFLKWPIEGGIHVNKPLLHPWHRLHWKMISRNKVNIILSSSMKRNQSHQRRYLVTLDSTVIKLKTRTWAPRTAFSHSFPSHVRHLGMKTRKTIFSLSPWLKTASWVTFLQHLYLLQRPNPTISQCHHVIWTALE